MPDAEVSLNLTGLGLRSPVGGGEESDLHHGGEGQLVHDATVMMAPGLTPAL